MQDILLVSGGLLFIFLMTSLGAATVVFFKKPSDSSGVMQRVFLGFAAGVMIAASVWSLIIPAIEEAEAAGQVGWIPAAGGVILGIAFLFLLDNLIPHIHPSLKQAEGPSSSLRRSTLLFLSVTLHNIPEGLAVGLSFALALQNPGEPAFMASAIALAIGIGIQNFPEGAAITLPLRQEGLSRSKAFGLGLVSGIMEPIFGILAILATAFILPAMPWLLCFAAGAMLYVVVEELIPEAHLGEHSHPGTFGVLAGFVIMMILDVALG